MNDMLGNEIKPGDTVLYDGDVCKCVNSTKSQIKYVFGTPYSDRELYEHGTTMQNKVLKLTDFNPSLVEAKIPELSVAANDYVKPSKRELTVEERTAAKIERDRKNKLKKDCKPFDIIETGHYENLIYLGRYNVIPAGEEDAGQYHIYLYAGYTSRRNPNLVDSILAQDSNRSYTITYQKSKKQPSNFVSTTRNDELKEHFKNIRTDGSRSSSYYDTNYTKIREIVQSLGE